MLLEIANDDFSDSQVLLLKIFKLSHFHFWRIKKKKKRQNATSSDILLSLLFLKVVMSAEGREKCIDSGLFSGLACSGRLPHIYSKAGS